jgi:ssDNA-binding Zn-finger/Zn-ribbon topoisomerase 1
VIEIIRSGLEGHALELPVAPAQQTPMCPTCGVEMVLRTARRGANVGRDFWGCPRFPACRHTIDVPPEHCAAS